MDNINLYKRANNQIKADENLKMKTRKQLLSNKKHYNRIAIKLANIAAIILVVFSIIWLSINQQANQMQSIVVLDSTKQTTNLPKVENKEILISMLEKLSNKQVNSVNESDEVSEQGEYDVADKQRHSDTIEQVEGVEEADIVKTDGEYIYYIEKQKVWIIKADTLQIINNIVYEESGFSPSELYLHKNYLVVIGQSLTQDNNDTAYYDVAYIGNTCALVYDISKKEDVKETRKIEIDGYTIASRMIDDMVYLVVNQPIELTDQTKADEEKLKPTYFDSAISEETQKIDFPEIYYFPEEISESCYLVLASFSVEQTTEAKIQAYLGSGNEVYVSERNIYVAKLNYNYDLIDQAKNIMGFRTYNDYTEIYKFGLKEGNIEYEASGSVPGYVLNQFSMDETDGYFRIATTEENETLNQSTNALFVLDNKLNIIGKLENLANGEKIYAVRYMKDKAYIVTFNQIDPLYVIDLSNPNLPIVSGELKVQGYSTYLHFYDETYLIGIGEATKLQGEDVVPSGIKISLFDISNMKQPKEVSTVTIGDRGTYSEATYNHKVFLFSKEKNLIVFPITVMENINGQTKITLQGAILYGISPEKQIYERGKIVANNSTEIIRRSFYIGDLLYVCSTEGIRVIDLNSMQEVNKVEL